LRWADGVAFECAALVLGQATPQPAVIPFSMANLRQASITGQRLQLTCAGTSQS